MLNRYANGHRRPGGPLAGVPDEGPVLAIASVTMPKPPVNGDLAAATTQIADRALRASACRSGDGRPLCAVVGEGARFDRGTIRSPGERACERRGPSWRALRRGACRARCSPRWRSTSRGASVVGGVRAARPRWASSSPAAASRCASVALPALPRHARQRFRYPLNWVVVAAGLVVLSIVACAIGASLLVVTGLDAAALDALSAGAGSGADGRLFHAASSAWPRRS